MQILLVDDNQDLGLRLQKMLSDFTTLRIHRESVEAFPALLDTYVGAKVVDDHYVFHLLDVPYFQRAYAAVSHINNNDKSDGFPAVALIDIDFDGQQEKQYFPTTEFRDEGGRVSGRLGWIIAAHLYQLSPYCRTIMYSGKDNVYNDCRELISPATFVDNGVTTEIPPLLSFRSKMTDPNQLLQPVKDALLQIGRHLYSETMKEAAAVISLLDSLTQKDIAEWPNRAQLLNDLGECAALFPFACKKIVNKDDDAQEAVRELLTVLGTFDFHWLLCSALKTLRGRDGLARYDSPLAIACHPPIRRSEILSELEKDLSVWLVKKCTDCFERRCFECNVFETVLAGWLELKCLLPIYTKEQILKDGHKYVNEEVLTVGPLQAFGEMYANCQRPNWESNFREAVSYCDCTGDGLDTPLLTDWAFLIREPKGIFYLLWQKGKQEGIDSCLHVSVRGDYFQITMVSKPKNHYPNGLIGDLRTLVNGLSFWGESYYEYSLPPVGDSEFAPIQRVHIWPRREPEANDVTPKNTPVFRVVWYVYDYLKCRTRDGC